MYYLCLFKRKTKKNTMASYRFKIVGVHYAVNTDHTRPAPETEEMHIRTATFLRGLDEARPPVVLMPEPSNPVDARAVMARARGKRIGYVDKTQLDTVHALLQAAGGGFLRTCISEVEARKHGWLHVTLEADAEVPVEPAQSHSDEWNGWTCTLPVIAPDEAHFARIEAEAMLDGVLSKYIADAGDGALKQGVIEDLDLVEEYIHLWLSSALHDLSEEARLTREHYIMVLKGLKERIVPPAQEPSSRNATPPQPLPRIKALVAALEKQRTAICGNRRMHLRIQGWWKELMQSEEMDILWKTWMARTGGDLEQGMNETLATLKALPYDLYAVIDDRGLFFSRLHYNHVPRKVFWQIVSLMLLRERALKEEGGGSETYPPLEQGRCVNDLLDASEECISTHPQEEEKFVVVIPKELKTPEARKVLAKLQKKGYLDEDLQPVKLSNTEKAVLAWHLTECLRIRKRWAVMATLWKCNPETLRKSYDKGYDKNVANEFSKKMKALIL